MKFEIRNATLQNYTNQWRNYFPGCTTYIPGKKIVPSLLLLITGTFAIFFFDEMYYGNYVYQKRGTPVISQRISENVNSRVCFKKDLLNYTIFERLNFAHMLVDDKRQFIYCMVPKAACTSWKAALAVSSGKITIKELHKLSKDQNKSSGLMKLGIVHQPDIYRPLAGLHPLNRYSPEEIKYRLDTYFKFMFVREPYSRLLSAWKDKFAAPRSSEKYREMYGVDIMKTYRNHQGHTSNITEVKIRFEEFIRYIVDLHKGGKKVDRHWDTYQNICYPCDIQYDFIGKLENIKEDAPKILNSISDPNSTLTEFPQENRSLFGHKCNKTIKQFYSKIPKGVMNQLRNVFMDDFHMFNYDPYLMR